MIPSIIFMGPNGYIAWDKTQTMVRNNWQLICEIMKKNGIIIDTFSGTRTFESQHNWDAFKCEGRCGGRVLPIDCADMDHRIPRISITSRITYQQSSTVLFDPILHQFVSYPSHIFRKDLLSHWIIGDTGLINIINHQNPGIIHGATYIRNNNEIEISFQFNGIIQKKKYLIEEILENDITNIQPLCPPCNRSKGGKF